MRKCCAVLCLVAQLYLALCNTTYFKPSRLLCLWGFSRQEYWGGLPFPTPGDLPYPGIKPESPALVGRFSTTEPPEKPMILDCAVLWLVALSFLTVCHPMECSPPGSSVYGDSPGKNTGMGCHALLQGIFLTQESNPCLLCLLHCRQILYCLSNHKYQSKHVNKQFYASIKCLDLLVLCTLLERK